MSALISIVNRKGGVGKTTLSIALAETFVFEHKRDVLILDLDPQSSASETILSEDQYSDCVEQEKTLAGYLARHMGGVADPPRDCIQHALHSFLDRGNCDLALLPNSADLWDLEWHALRTQSEHAFRAAVEAVLAHARAEFELTIIDCPPGRTISAEIAILDSDFILCPVVPERLSVWGMDRMRAYFDELAQTRELPPWRFVVSRAMLNTNEGQLQMEAIRQHYHDRLLHEAGGMFNPGAIDYLRLPRSQRVVDRIALFRDNPDRIRTLEQFYGAEVTGQLRRIARVALRDLRRNA